MQKYNKVVVCCPAELVTGGPELLHQFVHHLTEQGVDAHITYYPFCSKHSTPEAYKHYKINIWITTKNKYSKYNRNGNINIHI